MLDSEKKQLFKTSERIEIVLSRVEQRIKNINLKLKFVHFFLLQEKKILGMHQGDL
jgi:hypothetical protein